MCERAFGATLYSVFLKLHFRLYQSAFIQGQEIATLSAMTVNFAISKVLTYRDRQSLGPDYRH
jgi:hypothetical protein